MEVLKAHVRDGEAFNARLRFRRTPFDDALRGD
jgi:hypothetical protein